MPESTVRAENSDKEPARFDPPSSPLSSSHTLLHALIRLISRKGDFPWILLVVGLVITVGACLAMKYYVDRNAEDAFNHEYHEIKNAISDRLEDQAIILKSAATYFEVSETITPVQFESFVRHQAIQKQRLGEMGIGFSLYLTAAELPGHVRATRRAGNPAYSVRPDKVRGNYSPVIFMDPVVGNKMHILGYDLLSDPLNRFAMEKARDTGSAILSSKTALFREAVPTTEEGIMMFFPVYRNGMPVKTEEQRRAALYGWVFNPCRINDLTHGLLDDIILSEAKELHFQIYDGSSASPQSLIYESLRKHERHTHADVRFDRLLPLEFNGHLWTMRFIKPGGGLFSPENAIVWFVLASGLVSTVLFFFLVRSLLVFRGEAERIANNLTIDLHQNERFTSDILNSLPSNIAVLDKEGVIVAVNERWHTFAVNNNRSDAFASDLGRCYLDVCNNDECAGNDKKITEIRNGLWAVLVGKLETFNSEYPCHSPDIQRWFLLSATRLSGTRAGVVVSHTDITARKLAELELHNVLAELDERVDARTADLTRANEQLSLEIEEREKIGNSLKSAFQEISDLKDRLQAENIYLEAEVAKRHNFGDFIGQSKQLTMLFERVKQVAPLNATVLILGETGTGKGVVARAIHCHSGRKDRPMITVNCTSLPANLIESELFGREKGAFTGANARQIGRFELANGGTIFLDEIGEMPIELQSKLLRVIQDGEFELLGSPRTIKVDVRIIAATNRNLAEEIRTGRFREDLYYRLNVFPLLVPPLRERKEDIPLLVNHFVDQFNKKNNKNIEKVSVDTLKILQGYHWPGNVRELESFIERSVIISRGTTLQVYDRLEIMPITEEPRENGVKAIADLERDHILLVLQQTGWRINGEKGAAVILGLNPSTLRARIRKLNIVRN